MIATILNVFKKKEPFDKRKNIYNQGAENNAPEIVERLINNSVTAKMCANLMSQYLIGKGFGEVDDVLINSDTRLYDFAQDISSDKAKQRGVFIWIGWNANHKIKECKVLPFSNCRVGKKDDNDYFGKILYSDNWDDTKETIEVFDVFNPLPEVIDSQVKKAGSWSKYKGQVLYINDDNNSIYPLSRIDGSVGMDCDNEYKIAVYKNEILRNGFFGRTIVITKPLIDRNTPKQISVNGELVYNPEYRQLETERENFKTTIQNFCGVDNVGGALHLEIYFDHEDIDKQILFKNIESNINPDLFAKIEISVLENICRAFNNLPLGLVKHSSGGLNASGEQIEQMKKFYWENTEKERNEFERVLNLVWKHHEEFNGQYLTIKPYEFTTNKISE